MTSAGRDSRPLEGNPRAVVIVAELGAVVRWRRGKHKGQRHNFDRSYNKWVNSLPRAPTGVDGEAWCSAETARLIMNESQARLAV